MIYGKGTVKKYSREYVRTLKNGKKKKYKTEQIQITVSKHEDIYENNEEVLIIPTSSNDDIEELLSSDSSTNMYNKDIENLQYTIDEKNSIIKNYKEKIDLLETELQEIKLNYNEDLKDSYDSLKYDFKILKKELDEVRTNNSYNKSVIKKYKKFILETAN
jgi:hypothetical protein